MSPGDILFSGVNVIQGSECCPSGVKRSSENRDWTHGLKGEVTLEDHLPQLAEDQALGGGHVGPLHAHVHLTRPAVFPGLLRLTNTHTGNNTNIHILYMEKYPHLLYNG